MKAMLCLVVMAAIITAAGCGDDDATPSPTVSVTPSSVASASPTPTEQALTSTPTDAPDATANPALASFATFTQQIDTAVQQQDADFFSDLGVEVTITCTGNEGGGLCEGQPANFTITGIPGVAWMSDAGSYTPIAAYNTMIAQWFAAAMPSQTDSYGNGVPRLAAIAGDSAQGDYYAIATTGIQRQSRAFRFAPDTSGGFDLTGEVLGAVSSTSADWLDGLCTNCYYDSFQTWP